VNLTWQLYVWPLNVALLVIKMTFADEQFFVPITKVNDRESFCFLVKNIETVDVMYGNDVFII